MAKYKLAGTIVVAAMLVSAGNAMGQGIPVIDQTAIAKHIESIAQLKAQLDALNQQLQQAEELYGSLNGVTNMASVASVLNNPEVRRALPAEFAAIEALMRGTSTDILGDSASQHVENNSTYRTDADDFYAQELSRIQSQNAGQMALGQQIYDAATKRLAGIDQLRQQISAARTAKDTADLQARLQAETAFLQNDVLRMEGLRMVQQAQSQIDNQRNAEEWRRRMDAMKAALQ